MKIVKWTEWIEIPVEVQGRYSPESGDDWNEPRVPENVEIEQIEACLYDDEKTIAKDLKALTDSIMIKCGEDFSRNGLLEIEEDDYI